MESIKILPSLAISENGFLFNANSGETFTANPIAVRILNEIKNGKSLEEVKNIILDEYEVDVDRLEQDIDEFLMQLKMLKLAEEL